MKTTQNFPFSVSWPIPLKAYWCPVKTKVDYNCRYISVSIDKPIDLDLPRPVLFNQQPVVWGLHLAHGSS